MKIKLFFLFLSLTLAPSALAQMALNLDATTDSPIGALPKGEVHISQISYEYFIPPTNIHLGYWTYRIHCQKEGKEYTLNCKDIQGSTTAKSKINIIPTASNLQDYWHCINISSLGIVSNIDNLYNVRFDIEEDAYNYVENVKKYGLVFEDPYLESYIYSLVAKIVPNRRPDGFPYDVKIIILQDDSMNACVFPNGLLVINTGLLATLRTEDELVAILAHEIAHYVANHALVNIKKTRDREKRAAAWAMVATTLAAASEAYSASQGVYYYGTLTASTAILSSIIAKDVINNLGLSFAKEQEEDADKMAVEVLKYLEYDKNALAAAFNRMAQSYNEEGNWASYYLSGDHPSLASRIEYSGTPYSWTDVDFEKKVSFAISSAAITKFQQGRYTQALQLTERNITNGVATDDDYLIKALCTLYLKNTVESNAEASKCIELAKTYNQSNPNIRRVEIICNLREGKKETALSNLNKYLEELDVKIGTISEESIVYSFYVSEKDWARKMKIKISGS